jgi:uncharacterized LabA/DUF88 family protein
MTTSFGIRAGKRVEVIIDGTHIYHAHRNLNFDIDYRLLHETLFEDYDLRKIFYHSRVIYNDAGEIQSGEIARVLDFLSHNGYTTLIGESKEWTNQSGQRVVRQSVDVPIACNMIESAKRVDEIIVFAGSEELIPAVHIAQDYGARVTFVSTIKCSPGMIGRDLRREADRFVDLDTIKDRFRRERVERVERSDNVTAPFVSPATVLEDRSLGARMSVRTSR